MASEGLQQDEMVRERIHVLGVELLIEWDTLVFLYGHSASLATVVQIARFTGYDTTQTGAALNKLVALGLIQRSHVSQGIRMYRYAAPEEPGRHSCLLGLMKTAQTRTGRLLLLLHLKRPRQEARRRRDGGLRLA